ncbi:hybrid sensor histidine kinase/response regulator [Tengunoibacter tsumagoiensis]|uniref:histidine kinase n=1 Tax=Tengunoibacter tsumagoiensis TaxID=2014871 RepID=A0A402A2H1_9CHLR|nr:hybrid sensor histidine kinase/response regulator [Tengunoibacter tsumagoiensis]GCE13324.1 hypothetical protein KTT_31830 [Tengunoibacter tsumagoiensis]
MTEKNPTICLIEDNPEDREVFRRYLLQDTDYQYQFYEEETGEKGLILCRTVQPDCILLDYNLPDIDGLEFLTELADESNGLVPYAVVMLTGLQDEGTALQAIKSGAQDYLVKAEMTPGNLLRAIHNAIERTAMRRDLEQHRRELEKKNQEIQAFAYALAHDLRAPLRAITGFSQIVANDYSTDLDETGKHYVSNIVRACLQMDRIIDDLLSYTRIEHRAVRLKPVMLRYSLLQVIENCRRQANGEDASITLDERMPMVYGDPTLINQIFMNLIDNALTYVPPGVIAEIKISAREEKSFVTICVEDNGIGIPPKQYERIFAIFQRLHGDDLYPGTGIGLAIVKKATELLGGQVWVEPGPEQGSRFFVRLPGTG